MYLKLKTPVQTGEVYSVFVRITDNVRKTHIHSLFKNIMVLLQQIVMILSVQFAFLSFILVFLQRKIFVITALVPQIGGLIGYCAEIYPTLLHGVWSHVNVGLIIAEWVALQVAVWQDPYEGFMILRADYVSSWTSCFCVYINMNQKLTSVRVPTFPNQDQKH